MCCQYLVVSFYIESQARGSGYRYSAQDRPTPWFASTTMLILLRGAADVLFFTPAGELMGRTTLAQDRVGVI